MDTFRSLDWWLLFAMSGLLLFGLAAIYSVALSKGGDYLALEKQLVSAAIALVVFFLVATSNYRLLRNYSILAYAVGVLLLVGVLLFGDTIRGTTGWFNFGAFSFQPVEYMKVALAIALATYFSERARRQIGWREIFESAAIAGIPVGLTLVQPDFGSASLLMFMWGVVLLFAGIKKKHVAILLGVFLVLSLIGWQFFLADYQRARVTSFLNPTADPLGQGYHVNQAMIAVGSGGWLGRGLGFGSQSQLKFLPESQTDFIFAVIAEELGFVGVLLVLLGFGLIFFRLFAHAMGTRDDFTSFLAIAFGGVLFAQFMVNVGMNLGMLPVTGVALPFVSYGGSSLLFTFLMLGIIQSIAIHARNVHVA